MSSGMNLGLNFMHACCWGWRVGEKGMCALIGTGGFSCVTWQRFRCPAPLHGPRHQINVEEDNQYLM